MIACKWVHSLCNWLISYPLPTNCSHRIAMVCFISPETFKMVRCPLIFIFEIISFSILYAPIIFANTGMIVQQTFILICKLLLTDVSVIWCFTFELIMFKYSLKGTCEDKEEWCSFQVPDCNQMRIKRTCLKSCNTCLGKC